MKKQRKKNKMRNTDLPYGKISIVKDFLPPPGELVFPNKKTRKITISLNEDSIAFFKKHAAKNNTKYQKMIRMLLDHYAKHYIKP